MNHNKMTVALNMIFDEKMLQLRDQLKAIVLSMTEEEFETWIKWTESTILRTQLELNDLKKEFKK